jgi:hypothetical protein
MEILWKNYANLYSELFEMGVYRAVRFRLNRVHEVAAYEAHPAGTMARKLCEMCLFHALLRELVQREQATPARESRGKPKQARYTFIYGTCPPDVFRLIVTKAVPKPVPPPPPLDPQRSSLTGGHASDGGGCSIM